MRAHWIAAASLLGLLAGCSAGDQPSGNKAVAKGSAAAPRVSAIAQGIATATRVGNLPDRGALVRYDDAKATVRTGATTWHPVSLSEAHARNAIGGELTLQTPEGKPIHLKYVSHVQHDDGNWTWVGRPEGAQPGTEAILTFGQQAVYGSIPNGANPLALTMAKGRAWMTETDLARADADLATAKPADADFVTPDMDGASAAIASAAATKAPATIAARKTITAGMRTEGATPSATTVDLMVGYSAGFTARVGGVSQAITRLTNIVDVANQAYANSRVGAQLRLVHATQVDFADNTSNRSALFALSGLACVTGSGGELPDGGVDCTSTTRPAALSALMSLRDLYGADLVTLVRATSPEQASCGIAWLGGAGQTPLEAYNDTALSIVSDSTGAVGGTVCRDETLAHETGHNMGLQHDRATAANNNNDGILDADEFGSRAWSFGYSTDVANGNFVDIMGVRVAGQSGFRVFSNPNITFCGGRACGVAGTADNALALAQNIPTVAAYRQGVTPAVGRFSRDVQGDGKDDFLWFNPGTHELYSWFMNGGTPIVGQTGGFGPASTMPQAAADFGGDGKADVVFANGLNVAMYTGTGTGTFSVVNIGAQPAGSVVLAAADFDNDAKADLLWLNPATRALTAWKMDGSTVVSSASTGTVIGGTSALAAGDFNGDNRIDVLLGNNDNLYMLTNNGAGGFAAAYIAGRPKGWQILATQDVNADGKADVLWYNSSTRELYYWIMNGSIPVVGKGGSFVIGGTSPITAGDYNGDNRLDIVLSSGQNLYMYLGNTAGTFTASYIAATPVGWNML